MLKISAYMCLNSCATTTRPCAQITYPNVLNYVFVGPVITLITCTRCVACIFQECAGAPNLAALISHLKGGEVRAHFPISLFPPHFVGKCTLFLSNFSSFRAYQSASSCPRIILLLQIQSVFESLKNRHKNI